MNRKKGVGCIEAKKHVKIERAEEEEEEKEEEINNNKKRHLIILFPTPRSIVKAGRV